MQFVAVVIATLSLAFLAEAVQFQVGSVGQEAPLYGSRGSFAQALVSPGGYGSGLLGKSIRYSTYGYPGYGSWSYGGYPSVHYVSYPGYNLGYGGGLSNLGYNLGYGGGLSNLGYNLGYGGGLSNLGYSSYGYYPQSLGYSTLGSTGGSGFGVAKVVSA